MSTIQCRSLDGRSYELPESAYEALRREHRGDVLRAGDGGYDESCRIWNGMVEHRPALVARCRDVDDIRRCVRFAVDRRMPLSVRGGGHQIGGLALADRGLTVDLSNWRAVGVTRTRDAGDRVAVEPGCRLGDVDEATAPHGLVVPAGIMSETGIAGLTLGGGFGWLSRRFGLTCDHLVEAEIVTGAGEVRTIDDAREPELMWALRGGGGGVGVVTRFVFRPRPLRPTVTAGPRVRRGTEAAESFARFRAVTDRAGEELTCLLKLGTAPPAPFVPETMHGQPAVLEVVCHCGEPDRAEQDLATLRSGAKPVADAITPRPFTEFQAMFDAGEPAGRRHYWKSEYLSELDDALGRILVEAFGRLPSRAANIKLYQLGGAVARESPVANAAAHRDARFIVVIASAWDDPAQDRANIAWVRQTWQRVHEKSARGGYLNFLTDDVADEERLAARAGVDLERLAAVRSRFDPHGVLASGSRAPIGARPGRAGPGR